MILVEKTIIRKNHQFYKEIDQLAFLSKNLYNATLYIYRQAFFAGIGLPRGTQLIGQFVKEKQIDYTALPRKVSAWVVFQAEQSWKDYFAALKAWKKNPEKFKARPEIPKYKHKTKGRNLLTYPVDAISLKGLKKGIIKLSGNNIQFTSQKVTKENIKQVLISLGTNCYIISSTYEVADVELKQTFHYAAIDLGLNNLATVTFSNNTHPLIINGKPLKSINQFYNKKKAELQSKLPKEQKTSNKIKQLTFKRNNKVNDYIHKASRILVNQLVSRDISQLIIGYNAGWKQEINIGKKNNQNFVPIPFLRFIEMIEYKCRMVGIKVILNEESYTSKCSFLDLESIEKHEEYAGKRIKRGLFRSSSGREINADINGSYNIMRKVVPEVFDKGIEGVAVHPVVVTL